MRSVYKHLLNYWSLADASGSRLDQCALGYTLTNTNTVTSVDGVVGQASKFVEASSQRLQSASQTFLQNQTSVTWACWVQLNSKSPGNFTIFGKTSGVSGEKEYLLQWIIATDRFRWSIYTATDVVNSVSANTFGAPSTSTWYFIVVDLDSTTFDATISVNAGTPDTMTLGAQGQQAAAVFAIGGAGATGAEYFDGKVCEVAHWNRVLLQSEKEWLYNKGRGRAFPWDRRSTLDLSRRQRSRRYANLLT